MGKDVQTAVKKDEDIVKPITLKEYLSYLGPATIVTMVVMGPGTVSTMMSGGAQLGPALGWVVVFSALTMWFFCVLSNKTTCMTGKPPLDVIGDIWKPLALIGAILWVIPQFFIVMVQGSGIAQTGAAITGLPPNVVVWPAILLACLVFYMGTFKWLKTVASILLSVMLVTSLILTFRLLFGGDLPVGQALSGLFIPTWPDHPYTASFFSGAVGGAGTWGILAYHGYAVKNAGNNKPSMLYVTNMDSFVLGFILFGIFSLSVYYATAGVFFPEGIVPKTAEEAAELFVPFLGVWSSYIFYLGFLGALFTTLAGTNILLVTCIFAVIDYYYKGKTKTDWRPVMENKNFRYALIIALFIVAGIGGVVGKPAILPTFVWSLSLATVFTPPGMALWIYLTNKKELMGKYTNTWYFNVCLVIMFIVIVYFAVQALPDLLRNPFSF